MKKYAFPFIIMLIIFAYSLQKVESYDFFWHLAQGEYFLANMAPLKADIYSYTHQGEPIKYYELISDAMFAAVYRMAGYHGICVFVAALVLIIFIIAFKHSSSLAHDKNAASALILFFIVLASPRISPRPEIFSFILLCLTLVLLKRWTAKRPYTGLYFIPIQFLWANIHMGGSICMYILLLFGFCKFTERLLFKGLIRPGKEETLAGGMYLLTVSSMIAAGSINPNGLEYFMSPFLVTKGAMKSISEWAPLSRQAVRDFYPMYIPGVLMIFLSVPFYFKKTRDLFMPILLALLFLLSFGAARYSSYLFIAAVFPVSVALQRVLDDYSPRIKIPLCAAVTCALVFLAFANMGMQRYRPIVPSLGLKYSDFPVEAVKFIRDLKS